MEPKRIYLDSRDWINLAKVASGKITDTDLVVYRKIKKLSETGMAIFPISFFHLEDMMILSNEERRKRTIDFMASLSGGWVLKPYVLYIEKEVENAILHKLGKQSIHNIKSEIVAKGLPYTVCEEYHISSTNPEVQKFLNERDQELRNLTNSRETMIKLMKNHTFSENFRKGKKVTIEATKNMELNRQKKMTMSKVRRYRNDLASYFHGSIFPHLVKIVYKNKIDINAVLPTTENEIEDLLENMPSANILFRLSYARDEEFGNRSIQVNDLADISHLAGAVPYCDIVTIDKTFASLCQKLALDKKYGCTVLRSLKDLNKII